MRFAQIKLNLCICQLSEIKAKGSKNEKRHKKVDLSKFPKGILLDIGCRDRKQLNFVGMDKQMHEGVDIVHDHEDFPYPLDDESCMTVKCMHVIEHVKPWLFFDFFNECGVPYSKRTGDVELSLRAFKGLLSRPTHCTHITKETWAVSRLAVRVVQPLQAKALET